MDMSPATGSAGFDLIATAILSVAWIGPVGLLVLTNHLGHA